MLFIDASVVIAILAEEEDAPSLIDRLEQDGGPYYVSPVVRMEATVSLTRRLAEAAGRGGPATPEMIDTARRLVEQFISDLDCKEAMISGDVGSKALDAARQFGKVMNHPAKLNMGDCFTYACARAYRTRIAYKGDDFTYTDLGWHSH
ncbi:type II toxin-antitoxin system VapC family toxin [Sinorhizobium meliloti]|uniref:type II toxin-antitoxin system VapC family toxin n=1 Tax=Rhizobium meliloti TaxID=382 RepID=UPI000FD716E9|nr:type II toxin-antitoxin system VapC family toxin [Sinorhizobium meliloti]RVG73711.1 type II toxin-antitoxin system VapC family toxin [Sinorhizobium meliloti]RVH52031.1 type II toxin-antitoxin system VapC family toxin [Sinorhizobium meliloti]